MAVSIVVPAYNAAGTIGETLESILAQSHRHWEAVVVDDGSADATGEAVGRFAERDARVRLVTQSNAGEAGARNTGVAQARFDWLLFLDADDWISPRHLERMTAELHAHPELDAVHCGYARVTPDGKHLEEPYRPPTGDLFPTLARRSAFPVHACVVRRALVDEVGRFDTSLRTCADWDLWQRVARAGARFGAVEEVLAFYRMTPSGASLDAWQLFEDDLRVLRRGHAPDARVRDPKPEHAGGAPADGVRTQEFYLLSWCAGLLLGRGGDARPLLNMVGEDRFPELFPDAVAQCIFEASALANCQLVDAWERLWPEIHRNVEDYLAALERQSAAPDLARRAGIALRTMILKHSPSWHAIVEEHERIVAGQAARIEELETRLAASDGEGTHWRNLAGEREGALSDRESVVENQKRTIGEHESSIEEQRRIVSEREKTIEEQQNVISERESSIRDLTQVISERDDSIRDLTQVISERETSIRDLTQVISERETSIRDLTQVVSERETSIRDLTQVVSERESSIREQTRVISERESFIREQQGLISERERVVDVQKDDIRGLEATRTSLERERDRLREEVRQTASERDALVHSYERKLGDLLLNRLRLRRPAMAADRLRSAARHRLEVGRLAVEGRLAGNGDSRRRVVASICSTFPIYSQTFVHQELTQLVRHGSDVRVIYSEEDSRDLLSPQHACLWEGKRRLFLNTEVHRRDLAHYRARMPEKIDYLVDRLGEASGLSRDAVSNHDNFLQAFSFTRMVEAYRPHYLHSYFFYDRSLMTLVAGYLLGIPRGVSCYADHLLKDYELKVVPLHMELCDVVVATSERIKRELLEIAPKTDPDRIIVKPNGIDTEAFPALARTEPEGGAPFRLVSVCRIEPKKGLLDLVDAVHVLRERGVKVEAHIVGTVDEWSQASREYKSRLDERITELGLWGTVHLEGRQNLEGILRFLGISHLFVAPFVETETGDKDGIPTALLEGMATGIAPVATDAGSITEVIEDGVDGLLVPQRDPEALANAIASLLADPERRARLGREAAATVRRRFDVNTCERVFHERVNALVERPRG
jgi:glycosyltransferase involved in cell wall biosynthesis